VDDVLLDHKVDSKKAKRPALASKPVNKDCTLLLSGLLYKPKDSIDNILFCNILYLCFGPIEGKKAHAFDGGIIAALSTCTIDDMCDLVEIKPLDILLRYFCTCAMA
jgi:hypothetical protein